MNFGATIEESSQIMELLGVAPYELDNPRRFSMLQDVAKYFSGRPDLRSRILKITSKHYGDKLEGVWTFVELENEKLRAIQKLEPSQFTEDIEEQIKTGILTKDNIARIKKDIEIREKDLRKERINAEIQDQQDRETVATMLAEPKQIDILTETKKLLSKVEELNKELSFYE